MAPADLLLLLLADVSRGVAALCRWIGEQLDDPGEEGGHAPGCRCERCEARRVNEEAW